jgi:hypothetical protein
MHWGYNNIQIKASNKWKAMFTTNHGLFEPQVMLFKLTNLPATFQALMNTIFVDLVAMGKVAIYLDDILIYSPTLVEHHTITYKVLCQLATHNLYLQLEKCKFQYNEVKYLGLIIWKREVTMDPVKVQAIVNWPHPKNLHKLCRFLGFANFYCHFIKEFSKIAHLLNDLTKKGILWSWSPIHNCVFHTLKQTFV